VGKISSACKVKLQANVEVLSPKAELLIRLEDKEDPISPICVLRVKGRRAESTAAGSATGWAATGAKKPEQWLFLRSPLKKGKNQVDVNLLTRGWNPTISAWVWSKKDPGKSSAYPNELPAPEELSLDAVELMKPVDASAVSLGTMTISRPVERIDGIFIDSVLPNSEGKEQPEYQKNLNTDGKPLTIGGMVFKRGIGVRVPSITVTADGKYRRFQAWVGIDTAVSSSAINYFDKPQLTFEVWVDGKKRWESGHLSVNDPPLRVDVDIAGAKVVELVTRGGEIKGQAVSNWTDWADAKLLR
jgi:hypothetical protein